MQDVVGIALAVEYAVILAVVKIVVRLVVVTVTKLGIGTIVTDPETPAARVEEVLVVFQPEDNLGPVKMPPVESGNAGWTVEVAISRVVTVSKNVEWTVVVGEASLVEATGERVTVVMPIVTLEIGV